MNVRHIPTLLLCARRLQDSHSSMQHKIVGMSNKKINLYFCDRDIFGAPGGVRIMEHPLREKVAGFSLSRLKIPSFCPLFWGAGSISKFYHPQCEKVAGFSLLQTKSRTSARLVWCAWRSSNPQPLVP